MDAEQFLLDSIGQITIHFAQKGLAITTDKVKELLESIIKKNPALRGQVNIEEITKNLPTSTDQGSRTTYNEETLARLLEIPLADLATVTPETLDMSVLYDHVRLESEFTTWLEEWGYDVVIGHPLAGLGGVEYVPDVYGTLNTLHGQFEICINFVSDRPPDEDRVLALLSKIETYAEAKETFAYGDIFAVITPHRFTQNAINAVGLQNKQESYYVFPLDGGDVYVLENARSPKDRLEQFQDKVKQAEEETRRSRIRRPAPDASPDGRSR